MAPFKVNDYARLPSKAPFAWLVYLVTNTVAGWLKGYFTNSFYLLAVFFGILALVSGIAFLIQVVANIINFFKKGTK